MLEIREFVAKFKNCRENEREKFIEKHILKDKYVPYAEKIDTCKTIVNTSCYRKIKVEGAEKTIFKLDSPARYFSYCIAMIRNYTDLVWSKDKTVEEFDLLSKYGLVDALFAYMPEKEVGTTKTILDMVLNDLMENERSVVSFMDSASEGFSDIFNAISEVMINELEKQKVD